MVAQHVTIIYFQTHTSLPLQLVVAVKPAVNKQRSEPTANNYVQANYKINIITTTSWLDSYSGK